VTEQSFLAHPDLLERDAELAVVRGLIDAIADGGRLLAIEGPPGIGKTALIAEAKALAQEAGVQVLGARGSELERSFSYGVVRQLFEPLFASLPADERDELLTGAAALAAPLFDAAPITAEPASDSSLATLHGLHWLTANLAAQRPLLLGLDDLHWCDLPSLRWLAYVLPRMEELAVLVVAGLRPEESGEDPDLLDRIVSDPLAAVIRPAPLSADAATLFLRETLAPEAEDGFCAACREETAGNPLLLRELVHVIAAEGLPQPRRTCPASAHLGRGLARAPSRFASPGFDRGRRRSRRLSRSSGTTPTRAKQLRLPTWTSRLRSRRLMRSRGRTCCARGRRWRSSIH